MYIFYYLLIIIYLCINYYGLRKRIIEKKKKNLPDMASRLERLYELLRKGTKWRWGKEQQNLFDKAKDVLCNPRLLVHFNLKKPLILACDASPYGVGGVLAHNAWVVRNPLFMFRKH